MTNEQFDRDLRATLDKLMAEKAPATLRACVERTLAEPQGTRRAWPRRQRAWLGAAILAAIVVAMPVAFGVLSSRPTVVTPLPTTTPSASPTPSRSPSAVAPHVAPSFGPALLGMPIVRLSSDVARRMTTTVTNAGPNTRPGGPPAGPYMYWEDRLNAGYLVFDLGGGSSRQFHLSPFKPGEVVEAMANDNGWLVIVVVPSGLNDCTARPSTPMPWRIEAAPMGADGMPSAPFQQIASGTEASLFDNPNIPRGTGVCGYPWPPMITLSGDLLAWSASSTPAMDAGSTVTIRSLATSTTIASYETTTRVVGLTVSSTAVAWVESTNALVGDGKPAWRVMQAGLSEVTPEPIDVGVTAADVAAARLTPPQIMLDDSALVVAGMTPALDTSILRIDDGQTVTIDAGSIDGRSCGGLIAVNAGRVVLDCSSSPFRDPTPSSNGQAVSRSFLAVWTPTDGLRAVQLGQEAPNAIFPIETGGWLVWYELDFAASHADPATSTGTYTAIPLDAIAAPAP